MKKKVSTVRRVPNGWAELQGRRLTIEETTERSETGDGRRDGLSSRVHSSHLFFARRRRSGGQRRERVTIRRRVRVDYRRGRGEWRERGEIGLSKQ